MRIQEHGGEAEASTWATKTKKNLIRIRLRGTVSLWLHCSFPRSVQCYTRGSPWSYSFSSEKRKSARWTSSFPSIPDASWELHLRNASQRILGESATDREGGNGLIATSVQILANCIPVSCGAWAEIPDPGSDHLQSWASASHWLGSLNGSSAWFGSPAKGIPWWGAPPTQEASQQPW